MNEGPVRDAVLFRRMDNCDGAASIKKSFLLCITSVKLY